MDLTWQEYRVLDLATEDEYWLNEVAESRDIRKGLPSAIHRGLVSLYIKGQPISDSEALDTLDVDQSWTDPSISFYATDAGRATYFALTSDDVVQFNIQAHAAQAQSDDDDRSPSGPSTAPQANGDDVGADGQQTGDA
jgi:hypothetical protein